MIPLNLFWLWLKFILKITPSLDTKHIIKLYNSSLLSMFQTVPQFRPAVKMGRWSCGAWTLASVSSHFRNTLPQSPASSTRQTARSFCQRLLTERSEPSTLPATEISGPSLRLDRLSAVASVSMLAENSSRLVELTSMKFFFGNFSLFWPTLLTHPHSLLSSETHNRHPRWCLRGSLFLILKLGFMTFSIRKS